MTSFSRASIRANLATCATLFLALFAACGAKPSLAANDDAKTPSASASSATKKIDDPTISNRVCVKLSRPAPPARGNASQQLGDAPRDADAASDAESNDAELELLGRQVADFRTKSGNGKYALEDELGAIRIIPQDSIVSVEPAPDVKLSELRATMKRALLDEFGDGFKILETKRFTIVYDSSDAYAEWCGRLFESLEDGMEQFAEKHELPTIPRVEPMIAVVFAKQADFIRYASKETSFPDKLAAYYNMQTNRTALYDLSEAEANKTATGSRRKRPTIMETREILSRPNAAFNVATVVHEAAHQVAFNRGLFLRTGPMALWLAEGTSLAFETPNGRARQNGWNYRGSLPVNERMRNLFLQRVDPAKDPFKTIVEQDRFYDDLEASYAASWALFYYLYKKRPKELAAYLKLLAEKQPYSVYPAEERVEDFEKFFGNDWDKLTKTLVKFVEKL